MSQTLNDLKTHLAAAFDDGADRELSFHPMFGIVCAYVNGHVLAWVTKQGLALKIGPEIGKEWYKEGARWLQFDADGPIFKSFFVVPQAVLSDEDKLAEWVQSSVEYVLSKPLPKERTRRKKRV